MQEINDIILKEKQKNQPNKSYIQWLQQLSDKKLTANFIAEVKQKKFLKDLYKQNTIDMNDYFKYSGKTEETTGFYKIVEENEKAYHKWVQKNPKAELLAHYMQKRRIENRNKLNKKHNG